MQEVNCCCKKKYKKKKNLKHFLKIVKVSNATKGSANLMSAVNVVDTVEISTTEMEPFGLKQ